MSRTLVVDASVALKWVVPERGSSDAEALLTDVAAGNIALAAPEHLVGEMANGLRKRVTQGVLESADATVALETVAAIDVEFFGGTERWFRTLRAATDWQVTAYDALYVSLAHDLDSELITADARLADAAQTKSLPVRMLGP